jgi:DNA-binding NtrC family response regulator
MSPVGQRRLGQVLQDDFAGRIVAACGHDIETAVTEGAFDADLFFRLAQTEIRIPPFSDRPEDAVWLLHQLFERFNGRENRRFAGISALADEAVRAYDWPGGGREIRSRLLRSLGLASGSHIQPADLFPERRAEGDRVLTLAEARDAAERAQIISALESTGGQVGEAARLLRVSRTTLWEKMTRYGLS